MVTSQATSRPGVDVHGVEQPDHRERDGALPGSRL
jgi:hypothetical protein